MNKQSPPSATVELKFHLETEDEWPPVAIEGLPCTQVTDGYRVEVAPLFVKNLSVGDIISPIIDEGGEVASWRHVSRSGRTTIWLLRMAETNQIEGVLEALRALSCNTVQLPEHGCYSIDVPAECSIADVDACLERLDQSRIAVAFPSFRHE